MGGEVLLGIDGIELLQQGDGAFCGCGMWGIEPAEFFELVDAGGFEEE